jgi:hypothetical protein
MRQMSSLVGNDAQVSVEGGDSEDGGGQVDDFVRGARQNQPDDQPAVPLSSGTRLGCMVR